MKSKRKISKYLKTTVKTQLYKIYEIQQKQFQKFIAIQGLLQTQEIIANKLTHNLKELEKEEQIKAMQQKEGKFRGWSAEGRKVEVRKEIKQRFFKIEKKINKTKSWCK